MADQRYIPPTLSVQSDVAQENIAVLDSMLNSISQGLFMVGANGRVIAFNQRACELLDLSSDFLAQQPTAEEVALFQFKRGDFGLSGNLVEQGGRAYVTSLGKAPVPEQYWRSTREGLVIEVKNKLLPTGGIVKTFTDVTDYMRSQIALRQSAALLDATQAMAGVGGWEVDSEDGQIFWTTEMYRILDTSPEKFSPNRSNVQQFFAPDTFSKIDIASQETFSGQMDHDLELQMITAKARHIWVHAKKTVTLDNGKVLKSTYMMRDITVEHEARAALRASERLLRSVTSQVPGMVYRIHTSCKNGGAELFHYSFVSDGVERLFGVTPEQAMADANSILSLRHPEDKITTAAEFERATNSEDTASIEFRVQLRDGTVKWVQMTSVPESRTDDEIVRTGMLVDITSQREVIEALRKSEAKFRHVAAQMPGVVYRAHSFATGGRYYSFVSPGVQKLFGVTPEEVLADGSLLPSFFHPDDRDSILLDMIEIARSDKTSETEFRVRLKDGVEKWIQQTSGLEYRNVSEVVRIGVLLDITARKRAESALRERDELWKLALECTGDGVWDLNILTGEGIVSKGMLDMYGFAAGELANEPAELDRRTHPEDVEQMRRDRQAHFDGVTSTYVNEHRIRCKDGTWKWIMSRGMVISRDTDGKPLRMAGTHTDITDRKKAESLIWRQANFDLLTGLPNRRMLRDRLTQDIKKCARTTTRLAVLFIDLDHFKEVNDTLGHAYGDTLLIEAAMRISRCVRDTDTVARMGGDEFTVLLPQLNDVTTVEQVAATVVEVMGSPFQLGSELAFVSASIGITLYPDDATDIDSLFKHADQALYAAKGAGRNRFCYFTPKLQSQAQNRVKLTNDLRGALSNKQFWLAYQPIVSLSTGRVHKAEALLRWQHPDRGLIYPADFIPIAERNGMIVDIGEWVFLQAAHQTAAWRRRLDPQFQISINKSPVQFHSDRHKQSVWFDYLKKLGLPGESTIIEITESSLLDNSPNVNAQLRHWREQGAGLALDDFGTGYSSLSSLHQRDIDFLKIDQSFIRGLLPETKELALCKTIVLMAHELGMKVIAEGVETPLQRSLLTAIGCDFAQGYLFAHPMSAIDFENYFKRSA